MTFTLIKNGQNIYTKKVIKNGPTHSNLSGVGKNCICTQNPHSKCISLDRIKSKTGFWHIQFDCFVFEFNKKKHNQSPWCQFNGFCIQLHEQCISQVKLQDCNNCTGSWGGVSNRTRFPFDLSLKIDHYFFFFLFLSSSSSSRSYTPLVLVLGYPLQFVTMCCSLQIKKKKRQNLEDFYGGRVIINRRFLIKPKAFNWCFVNVTRRTKSTKENKNPNSFDFCGQTSIEKD